MSQVAESIALNPLLGEVAEWSNVPDSKSGVPQGTAGSNPALSANLFVIVKSVDLFRYITKRNVG